MDHWDIRSEGVARIHLVQERNRLPLVSIKMVISWLAGRLLASDLWNKLAIPRDIMHLTDLYIHYLVMLIFKPNT